MGLRPNHRMGFGLLQTRSGDSDREYKQRLEVRHTDYIQSDAHWKTTHMSSDMLMG